MSDPFTPLDPVRMLLGDGDRASLLFLAEIVIRTLVMYGYTVLLARMVGQGSVGQIGPFELVLVIAVGSAAGDPMFYPEVPLLHGLLAITVVILAHRLTQLIASRNERIEEKLEGAPLLVVKDGAVIEQALGSGTLTKGELMALLRCNGVRDVGAVERAWLEPNGRLSVFRFEEERVREGQSTFPE